MAANKVVFTQSAHEDLERISSYLLERDPIAGEQTFERLISATKGLAQFPFMGPAMEVPRLRLAGYRRLVLEAYSIMYRVEGKTVVVYHIFNHRQDYARVFFMHENQ